MKAITKYVANNGKEFSTEKEAIEQDALIVQVDGIMSKLSPIPVRNDCDFSNGHFFIPQDSDIVKEVKREILTLIKVYINHKWIEQTLVDEAVHSSYVSRLVSEYNNLSPLAYAWYRLANIDNECREWGQGYFRENPEKSPALENETKPS